MATILQLFVLSFFFFFLLWFRFQVVLSGIVLLYLVQLGGMLSSLFVCIPSYFSFNELLVTASKKILLAGVFFFPVFWDNKKKKEQTGCYRGEGNKFDCQYCVFSGDDRQCRGWSSSGREHFFFYASQVVYRNMNVDSTK